MRRLRTTSCSHPRCQPKRFPGGLTKRQRECFSSGRLPAAARAGISAATAYRIANDPRLPSQKKEPRGRRRPDPLGEIFDSEVVPLLQSSPCIRPIAILEEMQHWHPPAAGPHALERRLRSWWAVNGPPQQVIFRQVHEPGRLGLSDFTEMSDVEIRITAAPRNGFGLMGATPVTLWRVRRCVRPADAHSSM